MSTENQQSSLFTLDDQTRVCRMLATRMEVLLRREHARVLYFEALSRQFAQRCDAGSMKKRAWISLLRLGPCLLTQKCTSDMAASVSMGLHLMQMELLESLAQGQGMEHPLARILVDRIGGDHDDVMRVMRMFFYQRVDMVREGLMHHAVMSNVTLCCTDIERWIERQSKLVDNIMG
jgi:hypothetical protein